MHPMPHIVSEAQSLVQECLQHGDQQVWGQAIQRPGADPDRALGSSGSQDRGRARGELSQRAEAQMGPPQQEHADDQGHPDGES